MGTREIRGGRSPGRNESCTCGSGLKYSQCHGDPVFKQTAMRIANHMITLLIVQRCHDKGIADADMTRKAIDKLTESANDMLPECVKLETDYDVQEGEPEPEIDKLEEKANEGSALEAMQRDSYLCDCGLRLPVGMECMKCKKGKDNG